LGGAAQQHGSHPREPPLSDAWFPRPGGPGSVVLLPPLGTFDAADVYRLLTDPEGEEWRDRVGVVGRRDGSGKATTRLLAAGGQVLKTRIDQAAPSLEALRAAVLAERAPGLSTGLWHPAKQWALIEADDAWYPVTIAPELFTLRRLEDPGERMAAWIRMIEIAVRVFDGHGLGLDINPANFGFEPSRGDAATAPYHYIDDETYASLAERDLAGALVSRIPEEPELDTGAWRAFGLGVAQALSKLPLGGLSWERICDEIQAYPLTSRYEAPRRALLDALLESRLVAVRRRRHPASEGPGLTCVLADVHANLPALEGVLAEARALGADSWLVVGDVVGYGPHPAECIRRLDALPDATILRGNHDHAIAHGRPEIGMNRLARRCAEWAIATLGSQERAWLGRLPVEHVEVAWMAVHGAPRDPRRFLAYVYELTYEDNLDYLRRIDIPLCFYGHTHVQRIHGPPAEATPRLGKDGAVAVSGGEACLVNPGSVGQPRDGDPRAAFALWDRRAEKVSFHRASYDLERTLQDIRTHGLPEELEERLVRGA
jgi:diadenosine tetraphosphatase ApaH/serine/threonine PP2A family protein phosphatase